MKIKELTLHNFKCFEDLKIEFNEEYTVLVGINGSGKSSILEGISVALGTYLWGFPDLKTTSLSVDHVHIKSVKNGSVFSSVRQYECSINVTVEDHEKNIHEWGRTKRKASGPAAMISPNSILDYAENLYASKLKGDMNVILPILACFGTNRLYNAKDKANSTYISNSNFLDGYKNCLSSVSNSNDMSEWIKRMTLVELQDGIKVPELQVVNDAITAIYTKLNSDIDNVAVKYSVKSNELELQYTEKNETYIMPMRLLSDGIRITLSMVANIAHRMALLNASLGSDILTKTPGIVLIDEIDMHLHPSWQKRIIQSLKEIFPMVQFIVTTHSPSVIANVTSDHLLLLNNGEIYKPARNTYGKNVDTILKEIMQTNSQADDVVQILKDFYQAIESQDLSKAEQLLENLKLLVGDDYSEYIEAKMTLELETI